MVDGVELLRKVLAHPEKHSTIFQMLFSHVTVDDFFSSIGIPIEHRSDFTFACYLKQAMEENSNAGK